MYRLVLPRGVVSGPLQTHTTRESPGTSDTADGCGPDIDDARSIHRLVSSDSVILFLLRFGTNENGYKGGREFAWVRKCEIWYVEGILDTDIVYNMLPEVLWSHGVFSFQSREKRVV